MHPGPDGVLRLRVPWREVVGWAMTLLAVAATGLADLRWGSGAGAIACLVVVVVVGGTVVPPMLGAVTAHPEGHLLVRALLRTSRYEIEEIDAVVVTVPGPGAEEWSWWRAETPGTPLPFVRVAELVLFSGVDVPLLCTQAVALRPLRRRLDRQVAALQAWLGAGPA